MTPFISLEAKSLKQLGQLAVDHIGECVGIRWQPCTTGSYRRAAIYFRYRDAARTFAHLARRQGFFAFDPQSTYHRLNSQGDPISHPYEPVAFRGFRVIALVQPDPRNANGWRQAPAYRDQGATGGWGVITERERQPSTSYRGQREPDAPLEQWLEADVERELDRITAEVNAWWQAGGREQESPEAYLAAVEQRRAAARTRKRVANGGPVSSPALQQAIAKGVEQVEQLQAKASAYRHHQQQRNRIAADDADVIGELGRWDGECISDEAWDVEFGIEREDDAQ